MDLRRRRWLVVPVVVVLGLVAASCGGDDDDEGEDGGGGIAATLADYSIDLSADSAPAGEVVFDVTNEADQIHEFVVLKTDLPEAELPTDENGDVNEEGDPGIELIGEIEDIEGGATQSLAVGLDAGSYVLICNLPGHYSQGMHTSFSVE